ncbi:hypothetical protein [Roseibium alexandrii]|uniref:Uncharacterized protein n=1 Tax=Roseibium alexandrii (strain DSM 17067 / NCIMB 14079 / DFL-11) TaxID=244592 RepID=A0A5E8H6Y9_ROSAD|nr:hypothetical protein [Roseibium alexandrii]EEE47813.2 hypothetical protein SADFL11_5103 [Roseibium alexandrii DFL-11]
MKYSVSHKGEIAQAVKIFGGTKTVKPGTKNLVVDLPKQLTEEQVEHYKARGVTFQKGAAKAKANQSTTKNGKTKTGQSDQNITALKAKVEQAEKAVAAAKTDETKAKAQEFLDEANKALTNAQSGS